MKKIVSAAMMMEMCMCRMCMPFCASASDMFSVYDVMGNAAEQASAE